MSYNVQNPFVVCKAAAGSGKTFTLVEEYLKLAMTVPSPAVRQNLAEWERELRVRFAGILAITFTNKAAGEMKSRVMDNLLALSKYGTDPKRSPMGKSLLQALNQLPCYAGKSLGESDLMWMAEVVYSAIMHRYSDLSVCTIDSFMHRIVRTFAHDLNCPSNFDVMIDRDDMVQQAVDRVMALIGTDQHEELTRMARAYADSRMVDEKSYNIESSLKNLSEQLFQEGTDRYMDALDSMKPSDFVDIHQSLTKQNKQFEAQVKACGERMMAKLRAIGVADSDCASGARGYYGFFKGAAEGRIRPLTVTTVRAFEEGKLSSAKCPRSLADVLEAESRALTDIYLEMRNLVGVDGMDDTAEAKALCYYNTRRVVLANLYAMGMLRAIEEQIRDYSRENEVIHLSEFNRLINAIVQEQPAPFIYERLGNRYRHFLIDEFQDTSVLQWQNLVPLLANGVSQQYESLVVGDGKQAIYRFRQGDVRQFVRLPHVEDMPVHDRTLSAKGNYTLLPRNTNYRTTKCVVGFNNTFFEWLLDQEPFKSNSLAQQIYIGQRDEDGHPEVYQHLPSPDKPRGYVDVHFIDKGDREEIYEYIRQTIIRLVTKQGYRQEDIMILARDKRDLDRIGTYLQTHTDGMKIDITSSESFFLVRSQAVMAIVATLRLIKDNSNLVAAAELMQRLYDLDLIADTHAEEFVGGQPVDVSALLRSEGREFDLRLDYLATLDLYDCCEEIIRQLHLDETDVAYVGSLLGQVASFVASRHEGVGAFLEWFDDNASADFTLPKHRQLSAASPEGVDAVRLLTIHKAKGLEAPVVICPFFPRQAKPFKMWVDVGDRIDSGESRLPVAYVELDRTTSTRFNEERDREKRLEEVDNLNVLYVALTRPEEQLYVVCPTPSDDKGSDSMKYHSYFKEFLDSHHLDMGDVDFVHIEKKEDEQKKKPVVTSVHRISYSDWTVKVQVASPAEQALVPLLQEKIRFGNYLHEVMSYVLHASDVEGAIEKFAAKQSLAEDERRHLSDLVRKVVSHPDCARFFDEAYSVKTECDMVDKKGVLRPDRVVMTPTETWVVDFKTGVDLGKHHDRQVRRYCAAIGEMDYPNVSGWLVYMNDDIVVRPV